MPFLFSIALYCSFVVDELYYYYDRYLLAVSTVLNCLVHSHLPSWAIQQTLTTISAKQQETRLSLTSTVDSKQNKQFVLAEERSYSSRILSCTNIICYCAVYFFFWFNIKLATLERLIFFCSLFPTKQHQGIKRLASDYSQNKLNVHRWPNTLKFGSIVVNGFRIHSRESFETVRTNNIQDGFLCRQYRRQQVESIQS